MPSATNLSGEHKVSDLDQNLNLPDCTNARDDANRSKRWRSAGIDASMGTREVKSPPR